MMKQVRTDIRRPQAGMTLIESMVAMTISTTLILGSITMYSQARNNYRTTESVARMQENLRFSVDILDEDIRLAGYWGKASSGPIQRRGEVRVICGVNNIRDFALALTPGGERIVPIEAFQSADGLADAGCPATDPRDNSDVLIIRRASTNENDLNDLQAGVVQIQSNYSGGDFFDDFGDNGHPSVNTLPNGQVNDVVFSAYYVSNSSRYDADLPSLRRLTLVGNNIEDNELIAGVENLQVQFGVDQNDDGQIDQYVNGDRVTALDQIISARIWMLVRAEQNEAGLGYEDSKGPYTPLDPTADSIDPLGDDAEEYPPTFRRMEMARTIMLRN